MHFKWVFQLDDEPNHHMKDGWTSPFPSIKNFWLFRVPTVYIYIQRTCLFFPVKLLLNLTNCLLQPWKPVFRQAISYMIWSCKKTSSLCKMWLPISGSSHKLVPTMVPKTHMNNFGGAFFGGNILGNKLLGFDPFGGSWQKSCDKQEHCGH